MGFMKLPYNSERVLLELVRAENPTQVLRYKYERYSDNELGELNGVIRELRESGYINVKWANDMPYIVTINNSARRYEEQLAEYESKIDVQDTREKKLIFISHRSTDRDIADMLVDFFSGTGIPKDMFFCSSLPGNDINERISDEVKSALKHSVVNIAILSPDYYQSAYCLNEAGVLWYEDVPVIPIALPEINSSNMYGFLNNEYKLRRLDCDTDVSYIYDAVGEALSLPHNKASIITYENNKLRVRYTDYIKVREVRPMTTVTTIATSISEITTDDEKIVLYYILKNNVRKVSKAVVEKWLNESEIYGVNLDNAFDLLASFDGGNVSNDTLEFGLDIFRKCSTIATSVITELEECVKKHTKLAVDTFEAIWNSNTLDSTSGLFIAYIVDERMRSFGARWMAEGQIENIKQWENKFSLDSVLSSNYGSCLEFLVQKDLVYASGWTSHGNVREYSLRPSLQGFLFDCPMEIAEVLQKVKDAHYLELPF